MAQKSLFSVELLREAVHLADAAVLKGNHPFGALLASPENSILVRGENTVHTGADVTNHAEMNVIRQAQKLTPAQRASATLYTSTEPCAMCCGALYWAGVRRVVFACSERRLSEIVGSGLNASSRDIFAHASEPVQLVGPVLQDLAQNSHVAFWPKYLSGASTAHNDA
jgi:tRNA(Arg) A34 adenosine deaminase TadA